MSFDTAMLDAVTDRYSHLDTLPTHTAVRHDRQSKPVDRSSRDLNDEESLIQRCRNGDSEACAKLLKKYASLIYSVPLHMFGMSQDDAEDIYQICFVKVLNRARQFRGDSKFSAWLRTIVRNICVDCIRSQKGVVSLEALNENCETCPLSGVCTTEEILKQTEERSLLDDALGKLPSHYRRPIELFFFEDKSYKEISQILDEPVNTVGTHINRGLARLRKDLSADAEAFEALQY